MRHRTFIAIIMLALAGTAQPAAAQGTAFTYQGRLNDGANPASGSYDLRFVLYNADVGGNQQGPILTNAATTMNGGLFTVALDFGSGVFTGADRWLEIAVRTNGAGAFVSLDQRQRITATPYAVTAGGVSGVLTGANLAGTYSGAVTFNNSSNLFSGAFIGDGGGVTNVSAATLGGMAASNFWQTGGNAGTAADTHFLGTTDDQPLELRVNNQRVLRIEAGTGTLNMLVGPNRNSIASNVTSAGVLAGAFNVIHSNSSASVIAGGQGNTISNASGGTISGGTANIANGFTATVGGGAGNSASRDRSTVSGGTANQALGDTTFIGGGSGNSAGNLRSTIVAGNRNINNGINGFIGGGQSNTLSGSAATLGGGEFNTIQAGGSYATIPGGRANAANASFAFAAGHRAKANHNGAFVWADSADADFASTTTNQFNVRASGGARFETSGAGMTVDGQAVLAGTVGGGNLADSSVSTAKLTDGAVTAAKLGGDSVTSASIVNGSIQAADLSATGFDTTFWRAGGNAGTTAGVHFIGTTDNRAVEIKANNIRAARFEPSLNDAINSNIVNIVAGSPVNFAGAGVKGATIGGGGATKYFGSAYTNKVTGDFGSVGGGLGNSSGNDMATVGGGQVNNSSGFAATVSGGQFNNASSSYTTVSGGQNNISSGFAAAVGGGQNNASSGDYATVLGGYFNSAVGDYSLAAGRFAQANHPGTFVWADSQTASFASTTSNQFRVRAGGGLEVVGGAGAETLKISASRTGDFSTPVGLALNNNSAGQSAPALRVVNLGGDSDGGALSVSTAGTGFIAKFGNSSAFVADLSTNGTWRALAYNPLSDRHAKENFTPLDSREILEKVAALPLARWNYKAAPGLEHIGPVAQDFHAAFGLNGADDKHIATVDADGVALAAIQGLNQMLEEQRTELKTRETEIRELQSRNGSLETRLEKLEKLLGSLFRREETP